MIIYLLRETLFGGNIMIPIVQGDSNDSRHDPVVNPRNGLIIMIDRPCQGRIGRRERITLQLHNPNCCSWSSSKGYIHPRKQLSLPWWLSIDPDQSTKCFTQAYNSWNWLLTWQWSLIVSVDWPNEKWIWENPFNCHSLQVNIYRDRFLGKECLEYIGTLPIDQYSWLEMIFEEQFG